jgi:hypothetical protein
VVLYSSIVHLRLVIEFLVPLLDLVSALFVFQFVVLFGQDCVWLSYLVKNGSVMNTFFIEKRKKKVQIEHLKERKIVFYIAQVVGFLFCYMCCFAFMHIVLMQIIQLSFR